MIPWTYPCRCGYTDPNSHNEGCMYKVPLFVKNAPLKYSREEFEKEFELKPLGFKADILAMKMIKAENEHYQDKGHCNWSEPEYIWDEDTLTMRIEQVCLDCKEDA